MYLNEFDKFMSRVKLPEDASGCWEWINLRGCRSRPGAIYHGKSMPAARVAYMLYNSAYIPPNNYICHSCDNPQCVNPGHLWAGTPSDNTKDMYSKGCGYYQQPGVKLTEEQKDFNRRAGWVKQRKKNK